MPGTAVVSSSLRPGLGPVQPAGLTGPECVQQAGEIRPRLGSGVHRRCLTGQERAAFVDTKWTEDVGVAA